MTYRYLPLTEEDKKEMLSYLGIDDVEALFSDIDPNIRFKGELKISEKMSEPALVRHMKNLAGKNADLDEYACFLGAGVYDHYIPSVVDHIVSRSEFYTAYTPYQPEISQGELQAIFEFQSMMCELTGMDVANSSMYDGHTAVAEGATMAAGQTRKAKVVISKTVHPETREIVRSYCKGQHIDVAEVDYKDGVTDYDALKRAADEDTAAVIVQYPNFFGIVEDLSVVRDISRSVKAMMVVSANPLALGLLKPPGAFGADIVAGDAQPFGIPASFGGPHCGYFTVKEKWMRKMPGRVVGQTKDEEGRRGFVMTLQAREQHIRREKATSNICSNQALNALAAAVALTALGKEGLKRMAKLNLNKAHYARKRIAALPGCDVPFEQPFFNEFVVRLPAAVDEVNRRLLQKKLIGGYRLERDYPELKDHMLLAVTDARTKAEIDRLTDELGGLQ